MLSPDLPEAIGIDKLLEVLGGYGIKILHQTQHPDYFLCLTYAELSRQLNSPGNGLGDLYQVDLQAHRLERPWR